MSQKLRPYESIVILHPDTTEAQQKEIFQKSAGIIEDHKGSLNHIDTWGKRTLANPIKKQKIGTYFHLTFSSSSDTVSELERVMKINDKILRYFHVRLEDGTNLSQLVDNFKERLVENERREREREAKFQQKRAQRAAAR